MLYYLFTWLDKLYNIPGAGLFQFISFRTGMAVIFSLLITTVYGRRLIDMLRNKQVGETVRNLGLEGQTQKAGTPTMGGVIIILAIVVPTLLWAKLDNIYILLMLISTLWMGAIGFLDDYIKVFKKDKKDLSVLKRKGPEGPFTCRSVLTQANQARLHPRFLRTDKKRGSVTIFA